MNKPYIKNTGTTTLISSVPRKNCNNSDDYNKVDWNIDYDGHVANIDLDINSNGESKHLNYELTNGDLADILNVPSFAMPLEKRLVADFPLNQESFPVTNKNMFLVPMQKHRKKNLEPLLQSFRIKKLKSRSRRPRMGVSNFSSLKRKLITPRPKTIRIHLRPKTTTSARRKM
jgi:hypothetical protein